MLPVIVGLLLYLRFREVDTLYAPYQHFWNPVLFLVGRMSGMQIVYTIHEPSPAQGGFYSLAVRCRNRLSCALATKLVFLTKFVREEMERTGWVRYDKPVLVLPHGIIAPTGIDKMPRRHPGKEGTVFRFLYFGRVTPTKGVDLLLRAFSQLEEDVDLSVIGKWEMPRRRIERQTEGLRVVDDYVSEEALVDAFNHHDALVAPYVKASQSGVVTLAVAARMPMIVTDVGGLGEQVEDGETALVVPPDSDALAEAMRRFIHDDDLYEALSERLSALEDGRFNWSRLAGQLAEFFQR
jgi:glycosyltransferase involved in cell wall biosynthesis